MSEALARVRRETTDHPIERLADLARSRSSGELVASNHAIEAHVYLIRGRIAWATSTRTPNELARYLSERCGIDRASLRDVISECRRSGRRFGEALVARNIATADQIRTALRVQIECALDALTSIGSVKTLFFPRTLHYARELTFDLAEVLGERAARGASSPHEGVLAALSNALPAVSWAQLVGPNGAVGSSEPPDAAPSSSLLVELVDGLSECGDDELALRSHLGAIVGHALPERPLWSFCGLRADANFGLASAVVAQTLRVREPAPRRASTSASWVALPSEQLLTSLAPLESAIAQCDELLGAVVLRPDEPGALAAVHRRDFDLGSTVERAAGIGALIPPSLAAYCAPAPSSNSDLVDYERVTIYTADAAVRRFGAPLRARPRLALWTAVDRGAPAGFGWALLTTLTRQLEACVVE